MENRGLQIYNKREKELMAYREALEWSKEEAQKMFNVHVKDGYFDCLV